jgi:predicted component of type VI protein secretion system
MPAYLKPLGKGRPVLLDKPILFVGRHPECDIILLNSRKVSRKHCCIAQINNSFRIRDLGSTNGVSVNGTRVRKEAEMNIGDEVMFGDVAYQLLRGDASADAASGRDRKGAGADPLPAASMELSQEIPVAIHEEESQAPVPKPRKKPKIEDSDQDVVVLDESQYFFDDSNA